MGIKKSSMQVVNRSSISGRFVTKRYANTHKATTQTEHRPKKR